MVLIHLPENQKNFYKVINQSTGLNSQKKVKTLCGEFVSIFLINTNHVTCRICLGKVYNDNGDNENDK